MLTGAFGSILTMDCDYFEVQGFDIAGPAIVNGTNIYPVSGSDHGRLIDNDIHGSICQGISMDPNTAEYEIIGNRIHHNGVQETPCDQQAHGLYLQGDRHVVQNNLVYENHNYGIHRWPEGNDALIAYNTIAFNGSSGIILGGSNAMTGNRIVSNVIAFNGRFGISRNPNGSCDIYGNVIFGNTLGGLEPGFPPQCVGPNQQGDPRFVNVQRRDFHLLNGSPAIDAGDPVYAPGFDHDGLSRRLGAGPDIGAFEFASSGPRPPPPPPQTKPSPQARPTLGAGPRRDARS